MEFSASAGVYTRQIIIAPAYHDELLDEAKATGRKIENIMAARVEQYGSLKAEIERLQAELDVWNKTALEIATMVADGGRGDV